MNDYINRLQKLFRNLMLTEYGGGRTIKLPYFGGYLELKLEFNNGMIKVLSATSSVIGIRKSCESISLGYTDPVSLSRDVSKLTKSMSQEGMGVEAKLFHDCQPVSDDTRRAY